MSVLSLPEPPGWTAGRRRVYWVALGAALIFSPGVDYAVWGFMRGHYLAGVVAIGFVAWPYLLLGYLVRLLAGRTSLRAMSSSAGIVFRADRMLAWTMAIGLGCFIPAGIAFLVFAPMGMIVVPLSRGWRIVALIGVGSAVAIAVRGVVTLWRKRSIGMGSVLLTPSGIQVTTAVSTKTTSWDDVVDIGGEAPPRKTRTAIVLRRNDKTEQVLDGADFYVPKGVGLYWMVHHYWRHPEDRDELTDDRALAHLRDQEFDTS